MDDRISELPEAILQHILSLLTQEEAVQTCVVSKSWRYLWSARPEFILEEGNFGRHRKKFRNVLNKSLQVYYDRKLCIEKLGVFMSKFNLGTVRLLEKWIPKVAVKKLHLSYSYGNSGLLPSAVFESESLQELFLDTCKLRQIQINSVVCNILKTLLLEDVYFEDETFAKFLSSCSSIEHFSLKSCTGLRTINMHNHHNLKRLKIERTDDGSIEIYLPSSIERITIHQCPNWYHLRNYFPDLTCLKLSCTTLSDEWFNGFPRNFPCLEELDLWNCNGFDELKLSSPSIKKLHINMDESTTKATIDAPSIKEFFFRANISQPISFTATTSSEWNSEIHLSLNLDASQWFLKLSELVAALSQSQISLLLTHISGNKDPSDISTCCGASYEPVAIKSLDLHFSGAHYYDFFFSDLVNGLFRFVHPREIKQSGKDKFLCRTLQMGRWEEDEEGMRSSFFWQQDLEEVSLQVRNLNEQWHSVRGTIFWSEYVAALPKFYELSFRLKWREY